MIIKSHIRGGYRSAAEYMKDQGKNEKTRLVEISDPSAKDLDEAFHNMWVVTARTKCTKPLHHISINPMKDERLTDEQVMAIVQRCEEKYGYKMFHHQRVIVEHIKNGRQHFHVIWNRVSLMTGKPVWPGEHWNKSKQVCREMEIELGLKRPMHRRARKTKRTLKRKGKRQKKSGKKSRVRLQRSPHSKHKQGKLTPPTPSTKANSKKPTTTASKAATLAFDLIELITLARPAKHEPLMQQSRSTQKPMPYRPPHGKAIWPEAAILDWVTWGKRNPRRFFALWPELTR